MAGPITADATIAVITALPIEFTAVQLGGLLALARGERVDAGGDLASRVVAIVASFLQ